MVEGISPETSVAAKAYDYAHASDSTTGDALRGQVVDLMKQFHGTSGFDDGLTQRLKENGILPDLLLSEWEKLNTDDDKSNLSYSEILEAANSDDPLTNMLGNALNDPRLIGHINPETMYPDMSYDRAKALALETPDQRPLGPGVIDPATGLEITQPAAMVDGRLDIPAGSNLGIPAIEGYSAKSSEALASLQNPTLTPEAKLQAITTLVAEGHTTVPIKDSDGSTLNVRLEVSPISEGSSKSFVHMFAVDPTTGKESVMMRAITDGTNFFKQRDARGEEISFAGTKWMRNHPNSMFKS